MRSYAPNEPQPNSHRRSLVLTQLTTKLHTVQWQRAIPPYGGCRLRASGKTDSTRPAPSNETCPVDILFNNLPQREVPVCQKCRGLARCIIFVDFESNAVQGTSHCRIRPSRDNRDPRARYIHVQDSHGRYLLLHPRQGVSFSQETCRGVFGRTGSPPDACKRKPCVLTVPCSRICAVSPSTSRRI